MTISQESTQMLQTPLHSRHIQLGAKMADFAGYEMPIQYTGIMEEHLAVRNKAGLFDVSHLGEFSVKGAAAEDFIASLIPTSIKDQKDGEIRYTVLLNTNGGIVDDILVYKENSGSFCLVVNAGNIAAVERHIAAVDHKGAEVRNDSEHLACIALQGPEAVAIGDKIIGGNACELEYYRFKKLDGYQNVWVSRTGYTGEDGIEYFAPADEITDIWDKLIEEGKSEGVVPVGLGARNTLRLEVGNCLYGHEMDDNVPPQEARLGWLVNSEADYLGREALEKRGQAGFTKTIRGFKVTGRGVARDGYRITKNGRDIGHVTSGSYSPSLKQNIGLASIIKEEVVTGSVVQIEVHGRTVDAEIVKLPFVPIRHL